MPQETPSPIDLPAAPLEEPGLGWTTGAIVIATLFLLCANAVSLRDWIDDRPPSPLQAQAAVWADEWVAIAQAVGIGRPRDAIHDAWKQAEAARFHAHGISVERENSDPDDQR